MSFTFLSICSGIEGASLAFAGLDATCVGTAEIERFPASVIAHRYGSNMPGEPLSRNAPPNFGDFTQLIDPRSDARAHIAGKKIDVLIGGTPCQAFSVAGKRLSLEDARGNLTLAFAVLAHELVRSNGLRNAIWENVPGALNTPDNAFGCFLGALVGHDCAIPGPKGRGWPHSGMVDGPRARLAWRVLDAQYFGVPQRRERVFVVVDFGNGADPAEVLFEPQGLRGNSPPRREAREGIAIPIARGSGSSGGGRNDADAAETLIASTGEISHCLNAGGMGRQDYESETLIAHALRGEGFDASEDGTGRGTPIIPICFDETQITSKENRCNPQPGDPSHPLAKGARAPTIAFGISRDAIDRSGEGKAASPAERSGLGVVEDCSPTLKAKRPNAVAFRTSPNCGAWETGERIDALTTSADKTQHVVAFDLRGREGGAQFEGPHDTANIRAASGGSSRSYVAEQWAVRRLTPKECERLQGAVDDWTNIPQRGGKECPDGPRYKALGNSWAVPVVRWIGERLAAGLEAQQ